MILSTFSMNVNSSTSSTVPFANQGRRQPLKSGVDTVM